MHASQSFTLLHLEDHVKLGAIAAAASDNHDEVGPLCACSHVQEVSSAHVAKPIANSFLI